MELLISSVNINRFKFPIVILWTLRTLTLTLADGLFTTPLKAIVRRYYFVTLYITTSGSEVGPLVTSINL